MRVRIVDASFQVTNVRTRIPFKFGVQVLTDVPLAELAVTVENAAGEHARGFASDLLVPKWFEKNPDTTPEEDSAALASSTEMVAGTACTLGSIAGPHPVFELWNVLHTEHVGSRNHEDADVLVRGFGVAMVERASIDAACRLAEVPFHVALREGALGFNIRWVMPELAEWTPDRLGDPVRTIELRHTIGLLDPLTPSEIPADQRVEDGLPQSLTEDIEAYGVRWFKVKVCGDIDQDRERLRAIARVVSRHVGGNARFTLDGNEQCHDLEAFAGMLEELRTDPEAGALVERIELVEQPLSRKDTFDRAANAALGRLSGIAPVIIDEADTDVDAFARAIDLGYAGTSIKACKGVFRAIANRALIDTRQAAGEDGLFQSAEDLTNLGSIPLQQDLALQAALGMEHVERNGHHYFRGLDHLPKAARDRLVESLPGLYCRDGDLDRLRIEDGMLRLDEINGGIGFGGTLGSFQEAESE
jgi:hypothetical protein